GWAAASTQQFALRVPHRNCSCCAPKPPGNQRARAENADRSAERHRPADCGIRCRNAENEDRDVQRQNADCKQKPAALLKKSQGGSEQSDEGQGGRPYQQSQRDWTACSEIEVEKDA